MRKRVFITSKVAKLAIFVSASVLVGAGSLTVFYISNDTISYSQRLMSNKRLAQKNGGIISEAEYRQIANSPANLSKRSILRDAYGAAVSCDLLGKKEISEEQLIQFLDDFAHQPADKDAIDSVPMQDEIATQLETLTNAMLDRADELKYVNPQEFELKKKVLAQLSTISESLDGHLTYVGVLARAATSEKILKSVYEFQINSVAAPRLKDQLVEVCVPKLSKPIDLVSMFRFEYFRTTKYSEVINGTGKIDSKSQLFDQPKPLNMANRFLLLIPGVGAAWESRCHQAFADAIIQCGKSQLVNTPVDDMNLSILTATSRKVKVNNQYLQRYGFEEAIEAPMFAHKNWYLWHIDAQATKDHAIELGFIL